MKRLLLRGTLLLLALYGVITLFVRFGIPLATRTFAPDIGAYFARLRDADVSWDGICAAVISASCYLSGIIRRAWLRVLCVAAIFALALCFAQVNTVPLFRIAQSALTLLGG